MKSWLKEKFASFSRLREDIRKQAEEKGKNMQEIRRVNRFFLILIVAYIVLGMAWGFVPADNTIFLRRFTVLLPELIMLVIGCFYWVRSKVSFRELIRFHSLSPITILLILFLSITILPVVTLVNAISMLFATNIVSGEIGNMLTNSLSFGIFAIAIVPGFVEEFIYRGIIFQSYQKYSWKKAVLLSGFLFGIMHGNFNQFLYAWVLGMIFAVVVEVTDSILSTMIMHFMINGTNVVMAFLLEKYYELFGSSSAEAMAQSSGQLEIMDVLLLIPSGMIALAISIGILVLIGKLNGRNQIVYEKLVGSSKKIKESQEGLEETKKAAKIKMWTWHLTIGFILCLLLAVMVEFAARLQ